MAHYHQASSCLPTRLPACAMLLVVLVLGTLCSADAHRFVIVSDLHPTHAIIDQLDRLTREVLEIRPAFVVQLGDVGNDSFPGESVWQMKVIDAAFRRWREAGIEIHVAVGNHDVPADKPGVAVLKRNWFASQLPPYPMNAQLDADKHPEIWKRYCLEGKHYYAFTWRGVHFVIMDSENITDHQLAWLEAVLCRHEGNPSRYPTLVFAHDPHVMTGDRGHISRPLYRILEKCPDGHCVQAVFGGDFHYAQYWPPEENLGAHVYAVPASVLNFAIHHPQEPAYTEYIIATVTEDEIAFEPKPIGRGVNIFKDRVSYHPIARRRAD
ncbi:MAG TPA: metallophosphoesterase [Phycisphaerae bacterium]|nr:metallophosphoesterase [Phycisphaerae bacterium]HRR83951.1 metallophosphoesterase [Phycisphaerae bacterium]